MRGIVLISFAAASLLPAGCSRQAAEADVPPAVPVAAAAPAAPATRPATLPAPPPATKPAATSAWRPSDNPKIARFVGMTGDKPATWIEHPPQSRMRAANYTVPGRDGAEAAHIVVFQGVGGSIDANIDRWQTQFEPDANGDLVEPQISKFDAGGMPITLVELSGSWMKMGTTWFTPDQLFMTAIVESPQGVVFIRFAGQTVTVEANRPEFVKMVRSLRQNP